MLNILAIDCSIGSCSVALLMGEKIAEQFVLAQKQQAPHLLPMIDALLAEHHLKLNQLNAIAFACGPGNFTAIRIAASIVQGLSFAASLPVIPVSTLQALAQSAYREALEAEELKAKTILTAVDAYMGEIYWGAYQLDDENTMQALIPDMLCEPEHVIIPEQHEVYAVGNAWQTYQNILFEKTKEIKIKVANNIYPHAQDVAMLAKQLFLKGQFVSAEQAVPVYLRGEEAWKKMEEQRR